MDPVVVLAFWSLFGRFYGSCDNCPSFNFQELTESGSGCFSGHNSPYFLSLVSSCTCSYTKLNMSCCISWGFNCLILVNRIESYMPQKREYSISLSDFLCWHHRGKNKPLLVFCFWRRVTSCAAYTLKIWRATHFQMNDLGTDDYGIRVSDGAIFSWKGAWVMTPVQNQFNVASCVPFSVSAALGALQSICNANDDEILEDVEGVAYNLSKQEMVDCFPINGDGILLKFGYSYAIGRGLHSEEDYPYLAGPPYFVTYNSTCRCLELRHRTKISCMDVEFIKNEQVLAALRQQPLTAGLVLYDSFFRHRYPYKSAMELLDVYSPEPLELPRGVYRVGTELRGEPKYHSVLVTGWGYHNGTAYYIIKNWYGVDWGVNGYARVPVHMLSFFSRPLTPRTKRLAGG